MEFNVAAGIFHPFATTTQIARDGTHRSHITKNKQTHTQNRTNKKHKQNKTKQIKNNTRSMGPPGGGTKERKYLF